MEKWIFLQYRTQFSLIQDWIFLQQSSVFRYGTWHLDITYYPIIWPFTWKFPTRPHGYRDAILQSGCQSKVWATSHLKIALSQWDSVPLSQQRKQMLTLAYKQKDVLYYFFYCKAIQAASSIFNIFFVLFVFYCFFVVFFIVFIIVLVKGSMNPWDSKEVLLVFRGPGTRNKFNGKYTGSKHIAQVQCFRC